MASVMSAITNTVPITQFNRGLAGKIFEDVKQCGAKVVMKNNTAECVLLSPDEYIRLMDELNDARLAALAAERMAHFNPENTVSEAEMNRRLGITEDDLAGFDEVDIEKDLKALDGSQRILVLKAIKKVQQNPLPAEENGYGKSLGNYGSTGVAGLLKIKLRAAGLRVVYKLQRTESEMLVILIGVRADEEVYDIASKRAARHNLSD